MAREPETRLVYSTEGPVASQPQAADAPASAPGKGVRISLDRRASGRVVTVIRGLTGSAHEIAALARSLRSACGAGGAVKDGAVEIQGDHRERVEAALAARGIRSKRSGA
jgi:translation initiation factor 1